MKRWVWITLSAFAMAVLVWAAVELAPARRELSTLFPDGALLYIEAHDFHGLLKDWDASEQKRIWLKGDNYAGFSRSRLFARLAQAQDEFSTAASIPADSKLLGSVAGTESALALYDIGNLEFVYATRMSQAQAEATPLWQVRDKFEPRSEGNAQFYVRTDQQTNRTAAFALRDGWLVLGTRADLVAGVLDRLLAAGTRSLAGEAWYADALKQAQGPAQDLRMMLNLGKIVPSPYFRSYWVQHNVTEMKQYRAALCDLRRDADAYTEQRVLLRKSGVGAAAEGDVRPLMELAPQDAVFASAQASPAPERVLAELRENLLEQRSAQVETTWSAPAPPVAGADAGDPSDLETQIAAAPAIAAPHDPYERLHALLAAARPSALLLVYRTETENGEMFVRIEQGAVVEAASWNQQAVEETVSAALRPDLTASQLGVGWAARQGGAYAVLDGRVRLAVAVRGNRLFLASDESLLQAMLANESSKPAPHGDALTYSATFHHSQAEQQTLRALVSRLDSIAHGRGTQRSEDSDAGDGRPPAFFSGNAASLSRMFARVKRETVEERDEGALVRQQVRYEWQRP